MRKHFDGVSSLIAGAGCSLALLISAPAALGDISLAIDDNQYLANGDEDPVVYPFSPLGYPHYGFDAASFSEQWGVAFPEQFDLHGEYLSTTPLAPGQSLTINFDFFEPEGANYPRSLTLADTLSIVFTGTLPSGGDPTNLSIDLHYRSDGLEALVPLDHGIDIIEQYGFVVLDPYIVLNGGPADFHIQVQTLPTPGSVTLLAAAGFLLGARRRRAV